jgi:hypothetical protein
MFESVKPVPSHLLESEVSTLQSISHIKTTSTNTTPVTTPREPTLSAWRRTKNHERRTVDRPSSPSQSYDSSHSRIEHERENA